MTYDADVRESPSRWKTNRTWTVSQPCKTDAKERKGKLARTGEIRSWIGERASTGGAGTKDRPTAWNGDEARVDDVAMPVAQPKRGR